MHIKSLVFGNNAKTPQGLLIAIAVSTVLSIVSAASSGCRAIAKSMDYPEGPADVVLLFGRHYQGSMGDGRKAWMGSYSSKDDISVVSYLPNRSEFAFYVRRSPIVGLGEREAMVALARSLQMKTGATNGTLSWGKIKRQLVAKAERSREKTIEFDELTSQFTGIRPGGARFPQGDRVNTTAHIIRLSASHERPENALYFFAVSAIPVEVPPKEASELLRYFRAMLEGLTLYD